MKSHWFRRRQREEELDAEIRNHLDESIRDSIERGEAPEQARANALREFGNEKSSPGSCRLYDGLVPTARSERLTVGREGDRRDSIVVPSESGHLLSGWRVTR